MKFKSLLNLLFIASVFCLLTSCGGDGETPTCSNVSTLDGSVKIDGTTHALTIAQLLISAGGATFGDTYTFQIGGVDPDCAEVRAVNINVSVPSGESIDGTRDIKDFFDVADGDVYGTLTKQQLDPLSQSLEDLVSGTVTFTTSADNTYTIDLSATTVSGEDIDLEVTHMF